MSSKIGQFGPTQKDIAKALNVSRACVTIALNPKTRHKLLPDTVAMIEAKAKELNYRPQRQARILRTGRSHIIGVICQAGIYHSPQERVRHLARGAIQAGYQLISVELDWFDRDMDAVCNYLFDAAVEGIIFCNISPKEKSGWWDAIQERLLPVVSFSSMVEIDDQVQLDLHSAFRDMTLHHIAQGSRKPHLLLPYHDAFAEGEKQPSVIYDRVQGYLEAIQSVGGEVLAEPGSKNYFNLPQKTSASQKPPIEGRIHYPLRTDLYKNVFDLGYHEMKRLISIKKERPDSLICSNDDIAAGAISACSEQRVRVPHDIRISGADNTPFSSYCGVPLTTIEQPSQTMAQASIRRIVELIENPEEQRSPRREFFSCELILRKSTLCVSPH